MSSMLAYLDAGDKVWAHSDSGTAAAARVVISGAQLDATKPAFKVFSNGGFAFKVASVPFGKDATETVEFDINNLAGTSFGYSDGVYTAPENGA